jgi:hypothetical protein
MLIMWDFFFYLASILTLDLNIQWMAAKFVPFLLTDE